MAGLNRSSEGWNRAVGLVLRLTPFRANAFEADAIIIPTAVARASSNPVCRRHVEGHIVPKMNVRARMLNSGGWLTT